MTRLCAALLLGISLLSSWHASAGDEPLEKLQPRKAKKQEAPPAPMEEPADQLEPLKQKLQQGRGEEKQPLKAAPEARPDAPPTPERAKELLGRVGKNLEAAEDRLRKKDTGNETRSLQDQIVKDLDELIKQQNDKQQQQSQQKQQQKSQGQQGDDGQQSSSKSGASNQQSPEKNGGSQSKSSSGGQDSGGKQKGSGSGDSQPSASKSSGQGAGQPGGQSSGQSQSKSAKGGQGGQDGQGGQGGQGGGGGQGADAKNKPEAAGKELGNWGHLPETRRLELDQYARERFIRNYEEMLRQYYRTISSQGRK